MSEDRDKRLDEFLDSALAEYSQVEPRPGLENRILAGLAHTGERGWRWSWKWGVAFAAACIVIALLVAPGEKKRTPEISRTRTSSKAIPKISSGAEAPLSHRRLHERNLDSRQVALKHVATTQDSAVNQEAVVKQQIFPAPSPLSNQERLLLAYLRRTPYQELVQNSKPDEPKPILEMNQVMPGQAGSSDRNSNSR